MFCKLDGSAGASYNSYDPETGYVSYDDVKANNSFGLVEEVKFDELWHDECTTVLNMIDWSQMLNLKKLVVNNCNFVDFTFPSQARFNNLTEITITDSIIDVQTTKSLLSNAPRAVKFTKDENTLFTKSKDAAESLNQQQINARNISYHSSLGRAAEKYGISLQEMKDRDDETTGETEINEEDDFFEGSDFGGSEQSEDATYYSDSEASKSSSSSAMRGRVVHSPNEALSRHVEVGRRSQKRRDQLSETSSDASIGITKKYSEPTNRYSLDEEYQDSEADERQSQSTLSDVPRFEDLDRRTGLARVNPWEDEEDDIVETKVLCRLPNDSGEYLYASLDENQRQQISSMIIVGLGSETNVFDLPEIIWHNLTNLKSLSIERASIQESRLITMVGTPNPNAPPNLETLQIKEGCDINYAGIAYFVSNPKLTTLEINEEVREASRDATEIKNLFYIVSGRELLQEEDDEDLYSIDSLENPSNHRGPALFTEGFLRKNEPQCFLWGPDTSRSFPYSFLKEHNKLSNIRTMTYEGTGHDDNLMEADVDWNELRNLETLTVKNASVVGDAALNDTELTGLTSIQLEGCMIDLAAISSFERSASTLQRFTASGCTAESGEITQIDTILSKMNSRATIPASRAPSRGGEMSPNPSRLSGGSSDLSSQMGTEIPSPRGGANRRFSQPASQSAANLHGGQRRQRSSTHEFENDSGDESDASARSNFGEEDLDREDDISSKATTPRRNRLDTFRMGTGSMESSSRHRPESPRNSSQRWSGLQFGELEDDSDVDSRASASLRSTQSIASQNSRTSATSAFGSAGQMGRGASRGSVSGMSYQHTSESAAKSGQQEPVSIRCQTQRGWAHYKDISDKSTITEMWISAIAPDVAVMDTVDWRNLPNLQYLEIKNAMVESNKLAPLWEADNPILFPKLARIDLVDCRLNAGAVKEFHLSGSDSTLREIHLSRPRNFSGDGLDRNEMEKIDGILMELRRNDPSTQPYQSSRQQPHNQSSSSLFRRESRRDDTQFPTSQRRSETGAGVTHHYKHSVSQPELTLRNDSTPSRTYDALVADIQGTQVLLNNGNNLRDGSYEVYTDFENQELSIKYKKGRDLPIPILDATADSVKVHRGWRRVDNQTPLEVKAAIVLTSLGIPPCPPDIDIQAKKGSPLAAAIDRVFREMQSDPALNPFHEDHPDITVTKRH